LLSISALSGSESGWLPVGSSLVWRDKGALGKMTSNWRSVWTSIRLATRV
jgi:hypothetical protein